MDVRTGGKYRLEFSAGDSETMAFHGKYLEVIPNERIVWTNDEGEVGAVTTVTFENQSGKTLLNFRSNPRVGFWSFMSTRKPSRATSVAFREVISIFRADGNARRVDRFF